MPKKKTNKAAAKRFSVTAKGKVMYHMAGSGHLLSSKTTKRKRSLRRGRELSKPESKRITALLAS